MSIAAMVQEPETRLEFMTDQMLGGRVITCWGSAGSGKTTLSVNLGFELASLGKRVLVVDLDSYRPSIASLLGLTESGPGITAVLRLARAGRLNIEELNRLGQEMSFNKSSIRVITGINAPSRWPELDGAGIAELIRFAKDNYDFTVVDVASDLEEGLFSQVSAVPRNFAAGEAIRLSDLALGIFAADQVGVNRFLSDLREAGFEFWPIANRVRSSVLGRNPERQLRDTLFKIAQVKIHTTIPEDGAAVDMAQQRGQPLLLAAKSSKTREAIRLLALEIADL
jgi:MinD-like ATPase involved in chromosome partitioning or flagellar assembly